MNQIRQDLNPAAAAEIDGDQAVASLLLLDILAAVGDAVLAADLAVGGATADEAGLVEGGLVGADVVDGGSGEGTGDGDDEELEGVHFEGLGRVCCGEEVGERVVGVCERVSVEEERGGLFVE